MTVLVKHVHIMSSMHFLVWRLLLFCTK